MLQTSQIYVQQSGYWHYLEMQSLTSAGGSGKRPWAKLKSICMLEAARENATSMSDEQVDLPIIQISLTLRERGSLWSAVLKRY